MRACVESVINFDIEWDPRKKKEKMKERKNYIKWWVKN